MQRTVWDGARELQEIRMPDSASYADRDSLPPTSIGLIDQQSPVALQLDLSPHFGRVGYVHGGGPVDRPVAVVRTDYGDRGWFSPNNFAPQAYKRFQPFVVYPQWDQRGEPGLGSTSDGGAWPCEGAGASKRCTYPMPWSGLWGPNGVAFRSTSRVWMGSLLQDKREPNGLLYRRNRYLDPAAGRFTQPDPIGLAGGLSSYGFANGDPVNYADPFGLCPNGPVSCEALGLSAGGGLGAAVGLGVSAGCAVSTAGVCAAGTPLIVGASSGLGATVGGFAGKLLDLIILSKSHTTTTVNLPGRGPTRVDWEEPDDNGNPGNVHVQGKGKNAVPKTGIGGPEDIQKLPRDVRENEAIRRGIERALEQLRKFTESR